MVSTSDVIDLVAAVPDPELPFLTISDLGILRSVEVEGGRVRVCVTPTYSGCPALETIRADVEKVLAEAGFEADVETVLSPAWTTDWLSERGREALTQHGIAAPGRGPVELGLPRRHTSRVSLGSMSDDAYAGVIAPEPWGDRGRPVTLECPRCGSHDTEVMSRFGATACKALWRCRSCREPFEELKQH